MNWNEWLIINGHAFIAIGWWIPLFMFVQILCTDWVLMFALFLHNSFYVKIISRMGFPNVVASDKGLQWVGSRLSPGWNGMHNIIFPSSDYSSATAVDIITGGISKYSSKFLTLSQVQTIHFNYWAKGYRKAWLCKKISKRTKKTNNCLV